MRTDLPAVRPATPVEWQRLWDCDPTAEFYQSPAWAQLWARRAVGTEPGALAMTLTTGATVIVPLIKQVRYGGIVSRLMSNPTGSWSGWLSATPLTDPEAEEVVRHLLDQPNVAVDWRSTPLQHRACLPATHLGVSQLVDLRPGPDAVRARWSKGHKAAYKQGLKAGVAVRAAEGPEDWEQYHAVYLDTIARWRGKGQAVTSAFDRGVFEALRVTPGVRLWLAERAGEALAGGIFLHARRTVVYWSGAFRQDAAGLRPSNVLLGEAMLDAASNGLEWLDLGDSGVHDRVADFKRRFGAVALPFGIFSRKPARMRMIDKLGPLYGALTRA